MVADGELNDFHRHHIFSFPHEFSLGYGGALLRIFIGTLFLVTVRTIVKLPFVYLAKALGKA
jgi:hypothetical protein